MAAVAAAAIDISDDYSSCMYILQPLQRKWNKHGMRAQSVSHIKIAFLLFRLFNGIVIKSKSAALLTTLYASIV